MRPTFLSLGARLAALLPGERFSPVAWAGVAPIAAESAVVARQA